MGLVFLSKTHREQPFQKAQGLFLGSALPVLELRSVSKLEIKNVG